MLVSMSPRLLIDITKFDCKSYIRLNGSETISISVGGIVENHGHIRLQELRKYLTAIQFAHPNSLN